MILWFHSQEIDPTDELHMTGILYILGWHNLSKIITALGTLNPVFHHILGTSICLICLVHVQMKLTFGQGNVQNDSTKFSLIKAVFYHHATSSPEWSIFAADLGNFAIAARRSWLGPLFIWEQRFLQRQESSDPSQLSPSGGYEEMSPQKCTWNLKTVDGYTLKKKKYT